MPNPPMLLKTDAQIIAEYWQRETAIKMYDKLEEALAEIKRLAKNNANGIPNPSPIEGNDDRINQALQGAYWKGQKPALDILKRIQRLAEEALETEESNA